MPTQTKPLFRCGTTVLTPKVIAIAPDVDLVSLLNRHVRGDWGDTDPDGQRANQNALENGFQVLSVYNTSATSEGEIWLMTDANRSTTTFLLPSEY